jgi:hypothetical protein
VTGLLDTLRAIPTPALSTAPPREVADSLEYLASDAALESIAVDPYWPKWHSPWWHMVLLHELGLAAQIPPRALRAMIDGLNAMPVLTFPFRDADMPPGTDPNRHASCHCALGSIAQVLVAAGLDPVHELPWLSPWFPTYQMTDGGLSCDGEAYLVTGEVPSSMVGTIAPLEAMLAIGEPRTWSPAHRAFVDRAAAFVLGRRVLEGSSSRHNAAERAAAPAWRQICFPRFYLYDVLRGLSVVVRWAMLTGAALPVDAVMPAASHLAAAFPDGVVRLGRRSFEGIPTRRRAADGTWPRVPATVFPLLDAVSASRSCPYTTRHWTETRHALIDLLERA